MSASTEGVAAASGSASSGYAPAIDVVAAVVLAGGHSSRMGTDKASLPLGGTTLLGRTVRLLLDAGLDPVVVVRRADQLLPPLPTEVVTVVDDRPDQGPLQGIATGLSAVAAGDPRRAAAFVCATDLPELHAVFICHLVAALAEDTQAVVPVSGGRPQPLAAVYRVALGQRAEELLSQGERRASVLAAEPGVLLVDAAALLTHRGLAEKGLAETGLADEVLAAADPGLRSMHNVNDLATYLDVLDPESHARAPVVPPFPAPTMPRESRTAVLLGYLDFYRSVVLHKVAGLDETALRTSLLPSGWSPLELVKHLTFVEMRWLEWGFEGRPVDDPWGDRHEDRWHVRPDEPAALVLASLVDRGRRTTAIVRRHELDEAGAPGERWDGAPPATLERVLLHLMQEYARHAGHLDVVRELLDGATGEG